MKGMRKYFMDKLRALRAELDRKRQQRDVLNYEIAGLEAEYTRVFKRYHSRGWQWEEVEVDEYLSKGEKEVEADE